MKAKRLIVCFRVKLGFDRGEIKEYLWAACPSNGNV